MNLSSMKILVKKLDVSLESLYPHMRIENVANAGAVENCAYFIDTRRSRERGNRILQAWPRNRNGVVEYHIPSILCSEEENAEAKSNPKSNSKNSELFRDFSINHIEFVKEKLNRYFNEEKSYLWKL